MESTVQQTSAVFSTDNLNEVANFQRIETKKTSSNFFRSINTNQIAVDPEKLLNRICELMPGEYECVRYRRVETEPDLQDEEYGSVTENFFINDVSDDPQIFLDVVIQKCFKSPFLDEYVDVVITGLMDFAFHQGYMKMIHEYDVVEENLEAGVYTITMEERIQTQSGIKSRNHRKDTDEFADIYPELYPGIDVVKLIEDFIQSKENLLFLAGPPGIGKTTLIKYMLKKHAEINEHNVRALYIKDTTVLENPLFWGGLVEENKKFVLLDDLDKALVRPIIEEGASLEAVENKTNIVSSLLSFTDGVFETKTKFIITTNVQDVKIDSALLRPGRCYDILKFKPLEREYARELWTKFFERSGGEFDKIFTDPDGEELPEITQAHFMSELLLLKADRPRTYLTDQSISVRKYYLERNESKPMGFGR